MGESKGALLRLAIPMVALKVWFAILLLTYAPTRDTMLWVAATHWPLAIIVTMLVGPGLAGYRLMRARAQRAKMREAEFSVAPQCSALWETVSRLEAGD